MANKSSKTFKVPQLKKTWSAPTPEPCRDCPFRKNGPRGWIGAYESAEQIGTLVAGGVYKGQLQPEGRFPCHMHQNDLIAKGKPIGEAVKLARTCTGALSYMNVMCKLSSSPDIRKEQDEIGILDCVVHSPQELADHHDITKKNPK